MGLVVKDLFCPMASLLLSVSLTYIFRLEKGVFTSRSIWVGWTGAWWVWAGPGGARTENGMSDWSSLSMISSIVAGISLKAYLEFLAMFSGANVSFATTPKRSDHIMVIC
jgi:hypothetical protein